MFPLNIDILRVFMICLIIVILPADIIGTKFLMPRKPLKKDFYTDLHQQYGYRSLTIIKIIVLGFILYDLINPSGRRVLYLIPIVFYSYTVIKMFIRFYLVRL